MDEKLIRSALPVILHLQLNTSFFTQTQSLLFQHCIIFAGDSFAFFNSVPGRCNSNNRSTNQSNIGLLTVPPDPVRT